MPKTIKFWLMPNADYETKKLIDRELAHFHRKNPDIQVETRVIPWMHAWSNIMQACKDKSGVDILMLGTTWVQTLAYLGSIRKIDDLGEADGNFSKEYIRMCTYDKKLWAVPWFCEANVLFYRKDHLEKIGVSPYEIETWDGFAAACGKLRKLSGKAHTAFPLGFTIQPDQTFAQVLSCFIWSHGGDFISRDGKHPLLASTDVYRGLKKLLKFITGEYIDPASLHISTGEVIGDFFCHNAYTFIISSPWPIRVYLNPSSPAFIGNKQNENFGLMNLPGGPSGRFNFTGGSTLAVTSFSQHQRDSVKVVEFLSSAESQERYCRAIDAIPARTDAAINLPLLRGKEAIFKEAVAVYGRSFPTHLLWGSIERIVISGMSFAFGEFVKNRNEAAFKKNLRELDKEISRIFRIFGE